MPFWRRDFRTSCPGAVRPTIKCICPLVSVVVGLGFSTVAEGSELILGKITVLVWQVSVSGWLSSVCSVGSVGGWLQALSFPFWWLTLVSLCRMLYDYVERKRKENSGAQLHVTYLVAGNLLQNGYVVSVSLLTGVYELFVVVSALPWFVILGSKAELAPFAAGAAVCQGSWTGTKSRLSVCPSMHTTGREDQLVVVWDTRC